MDGWRARLRLAASMVAVTSVAWVLGLALWWNWAGCVRSRDPVATPAPAPPSSAAPRDAGALTIPVAGVTRTELVDSFADSRGEGSRRHEAIDILAPAGTPVLAAMEGRIEKLFLSRDGGRTIYQRSADGRLIAYYAHLSDYAPGLGEGQTVRRGAVLGAVGSSGNADPASPHLHFAIARIAPQDRWYGKGEVVDPFPLLGGSATR